jgi:hypothetical protein
MSFPGLHPYASGFPNACEYRCRFSGCSLSALFLEDLSSVGLNTIPDRSKSQGRTHILSVEIVSSFVGKRSSAPSSVQITRSGTYCNSVRHKLTPATLPLQAPHEGIPGLMAPCSPSLASSAWLPIPSASGCGSWGFGLLSEFARLAGDEEGVLSHSAQRVFRWSNISGFRRGFPTTIHRRDSVTALPARTQFA